MVQRIRSQPVFLLVRFIRDPFIWGAILYLIFKGKSMSTQVNIANQFE